MSGPAPQYFDLNIGDILEAWQPRHAVRELIANALDEQSLTGTRDIVIAEIDGGWSIRDFGRGLNVEHLRQDENEEKLKNAAKVIGKFGFGLKDGLATLHRRGVQVELRSRHGDICIVERAKSGFELSTLHAVIKPPSDPRRVGTEVILHGLERAEMVAAKAFFLRFSDEESLGRTPFGEILRRGEGTPGRVYIKGLLVAEEPAFALSYNITSLTTSMDKALNRERTNVGRGAYSERVKAMLLACDAPVVVDILVREVSALDQGTAHDEVKWTDVAVHACKLLNRTNQVVFASSGELNDARDMVDHVRNDGLQLVTLPQAIRDRLRQEHDGTGAPVRGLDVFARQWARSFEFKFVSEEALTSSEQSLFARREDIAALAGGWPPGVRQVLISESMRPDAYGRADAVGLWEHDTGRIIIKRDQLRSLKSFAGTLLHELAHARSGEEDVSRGFEEALTELLGTVVARSLPPSARPRTKAAPKVRRRTRGRPTSGANARKKPKETKRKRR